MKISLILERYSPDKLMSLEFFFNMYHQAWLKHLRLLVSKISFQRTICLSKFGSSVYDLAFRFPHIVVLTKDRPVSEDLTLYVTLIRNKAQFVSCFTSFCGNCNKFINVKHITTRCLKYKSILMKSDEVTEPVKYESKFWWSVYENYLLFEPAPEGLSHVRKCLNSF